VAVDGQAVEFDFADGRLYLKAFVENTATVVGRLAD